MEPIDFIVPGIEIETDDGVSVISTVEKMFEADGVRVANCNLVNEDGTEFTHVDLRGDEYEDAWKFSSPNGAIVDAILELDEEVGRVNRLIENDRYGDGWIAHASVILMRLSISAIFFAWSYKTMTLAA